jgi:hypothetical protein
MTKKLLLFVAVLVFSCLGHAQQVEVSAGKGGVITLAVAAQKTYQIIAGQNRTPVLTFECAHKGKKGGHLVIFSPGGEMLLGNESQGLSAASAPQTLTVTINGKAETTIWAPYGDVASFTYYGKTEPERIQFIHELLSAGMVSIEFKPFVTGIKIKSTFDLSQLREEFNKHAECSEQ